MSNVIYYRVYSYNNEFALEVEGASEFGMAWDFVKTGRSDMLLHEFAQNNGWTNYTNPTAATAATAAMERVAYLEAKMSEIKEAFFCDPMLIDDREPIEFESIESVLTRRHNRIYSVIDGCDYE